MKSTVFRKALRELNSFLLFFVSVGFVVSCCMMLFLQVLSKEMGLVYTPENIADAAKITFLNVIIITVLFKAIDCIRRKIMVERPVKMITDATEQIMKGDFSVRVKPMNASGMEGFNKIGQAINSMAQELSGVETLRADFIANVSHEIKTPLSVIHNYATLLHSDALPAKKITEYARAITDAGNRLSDMITNILKLNRLENQQIFPRADVFDLGEQLCECLLQYEFVTEMLRLAKAEGISTAVDTSGAVNWKSIEATLNYTDIYLYDVKCATSELHEKVIGTDNRIILENLNRLDESGAKIWIRIPVIPDFNDNREEIDKIAEILSKLKGVERATLIPYHTLGKNKYETIGMSCHYNTEQRISHKKLEEYKEIFRKKGIFTE